MYDMLKSLVIGWEVKAELDDQSFCWSLQRISFIKGGGGGLHFLVTTPFYFFLNIKIRNVLDYLLDFKLSNLYPVQKELFYYWGWSDFLI